jgi:hypothetical protein
MQAVQFVDVAGLTVALTAAGLLDDA